MSALAAFDPLGLPAPAWLLFGLKVFGFWIHLFFMNLWFAGLPVGLWLARRGGPSAEAGRRLVRAMPVIVALGVNAGIVPLLFLQVLYPQFFYTSTILQAWPWLAVIGLMLVAYYGVYVYVLGKKTGSRNPWITAAGWVSAALFLVMGLVFSTEMTFLPRADQWSALAEPNVGGAVLGTGFALSGTALARYVLVFGLALATTGAWLAVDAWFFQGGEGAAPSEAEAGGRRSGQAGLGRVVFGLVTAGLVVFGVAGGLYLLAQPGLPAALGLQAAAGVGPVLAFLAAVAYLRRPGRGTAGLLMGAQVLSLLMNAVSRQVVQVREVAAFFDLGSVEVNLQLSPIVLFLGFFVLGAGIVGWLVKVFLSARRTPAPGTAA